MRSILFAAGLAAALVFSAPSSLAQTAIASALNCSTNSSGTASTANGHISWPAGNPVWEFDFFRPSNRTTGQSSGLEIRNVTYLGRKVFERASVPILNVEYDAGGCGCYRDWQYSEVNTVADGVVSGVNCYAEATPGTVSTTCETGTGGTPGSFRGIAVEDYGTELVLTAHMSAGWYRYRMKWHFYSDGRIWPEYSFAAATATCTSASHRHHAYWRFDFDLEDTPNNDVISERGTSREPLLFATEADRTWGQPTDGIYWRVEDSENHVGFDIIPSTEDLKLPIDAFSKTDALVLRYKANEIDDGIGLGSGCAFVYDQQNWVNNESLDNQDVVFWYRSSALHTGGNPFECDIVGPTLRPFGYTSVANGPAPLEGSVEIQAATPNPFTPSTTVRFRVSEAQDVTVALYDAVGRRVQDLFTGPVQANHYETVTIDGANLPTGTYIVRLEGNTVSASTRVILVR